MQRHVYPSALHSPRSSVAPLGLSTRENLPPRPDYVNLNIRRPSQTWLNSPNPGWMDGASDPPICFKDQDEIITTMLTWNPGHPMFKPLDTVSHAPCFEEATAPGVASEVTGATNAGHEGPAPSSGYQVSVLIQYTTPDLGKAGLRGKPALKLIKNTKLVIIDIDNTDRMGLVKSALMAHGYEDDYAPGVHRGPPIKMSWTGSSGGKSGAATIETDAEYNIVVMSLKKKTNPAVLVELNLDEMDGFRVMKKRSLSILPSPESSPYSSPLLSPCPMPSKTLPQDGDENIELLYGTKVPRVDDFSFQDQLHGAMIMKLNEKWSCEKHPGENGDLGHCYIDVNGKHIGLNMRKNKAWASAIVAGEATIHEPPNVLEFDGFRDGHLTVARPRGRGGPRSYASGPSGGGGGDTATVLLAAMIPFLHNLAPKTDPLKTPPRTALPVAFPTTPKKPTVSLSPIPTRSSELHACLDDFLRLKGINLLEAESALAQLSLTPDIIAGVPVPRLCEITSAVEGHLWGLQAFCREWSSRLEEKKRRLTLVSSMTYISLQFC
ncbi:hypothetical protein DFH07DRAFT_766239 [Mycena maculata]|uniref:Uncharacterized protein n=1 Tax=Mycena maculata TaxID=230809 RepID=A0AAD7K4F8_9AGAR|nr:hypothetical protein DFH07DRAFT_766239 [Mycena maculata]